MSIEYRTRRRSCAELISVMLDCPSHGERDAFSDRMNERCSGHRIRRLYFFGSPNTPPTPTATQPAARRIVHRGHTHQSVHDHGRRCRHRVSALGRVGQS
jgi:hypothetical protein